MRNKEHIAATNHICQINDPGSVTGGCEVLNLAG
jgi:hypothetical protein